MDVTIPLDLLVEIAAIAGGLLIVWGMMRQRVHDLERRVGHVETKHDSHVEKMDKLCNEVSALVGRFDVLIGIGKAGALAARA